MPGLGCRSVLSPPALGGYLYVAPTLPVLSEKESQSICRSDEADALSSTWPPPHPSSWHLVCHCPHCYPYLTHRFTQDVVPDQSRIRHENDTKPFATLVRRLGECWSRSRHSPRTLRPYNSNPTKPPWKPTEAPDLFPVGRTSRHRSRWGSTPSRRGSCTALRHKRLLAAVVPVHRDPVPSR